PSVRRPAALPPASPATAAPVPPPRRPRRWCPPGRPADRPARRGAGSGRLLGRRAARRQTKAEDRPARRVVLGADPAIVVGDDAMDDRQAEAGTAPLAREGRQEQLVAIARRQSASVVGDRDL